MSERVFSDAIFAKVSCSAVRYAQKAAKRKPSFVDVIDRFSAITGIKFSKENTKSYDYLDELLQQLDLFLQSEQKKARENINQYDFYRHTELHILRNHLKKEHSKLFTCCAANKFR